MNNLTIVTKLRFIAALAPAILLIAAAVIAGAFHVFGTLPREIHDNEYAAERAAQGMETALYKMDWGRTQPDASQIVMDQQRGFISEIEIARQHIGKPRASRTDRKNRQRRAPAVRRDANRVAQRRQPRAEAPRSARQVADLISLDDAAVIAVANSAESQARLMIAITIVALVAVPWICFVLIARLSGNLYKELKEMRRRVDDLAEHAPTPSDDISALDEALTKLGFPKPNPMLAE